ncbi:uncharacterized protein [Dysidea avara]|uniref:uncharacterized protein isoform X2 n=1 Tax=Dysidea avara TaxID=196820 RepID=UPI0033231616
MTCTFTASQTPYLSICAWSNKDGRINPSHKYHFNQTSVSGRDNQVACTLTVADVTNADEGKYYCYCFYNESFWLKYHFPQYSNISSQHGETNVQLTDDNSELFILLEVVGGSFGLTIGLLTVLLAIYLIRRWYKSRPGRDITATSVPCSGDGDTTSSGDRGSDTNRGKELQFIPDTANGNNIPNGTNQNGTGTGSDIERDGTRQGDPDQGSQEEIGGDRFVDQAESNRRSDANSGEQLRFMSDAANGNNIPNGTNQNGTGNGSDMEHDGRAHQGDPDHRYTTPQQVDSSSVGVDQIADQLSCSESNINQVVKIIEQPQDLTIRVKEKRFIVTLCCNAESRCGYQLNYKWYCLGDNDNLGRNKTSTGNGPLLKITMSLSIMAGKRFNCEVSAGGYTVLSRVAEINLETVWIVEEPKLVTKVFAGYSLELSCKAESAPDVDVTYRWYKCNKDGHIEELVEKCLESKMVISEVTHSHQGHYKCVVSPEVSSRVVYVEVMTPTNIKFTTQPPKQQCIEFGEELTLTCEAVCEDNPVNYQWYYNKQRLINANRSQLVISQVAKEDGGLYQCEVRSEYSAQVVYSVATQIQPSSSANLPICDLQLQAEETVGHATDKMALLIGNGNYRGSTKHLRCPPNDVKAMTEKLQELGFKTLSLVDVSLNEMSRAINYFCGLLRKGMYAVFYYSGHGLGNENTTYLMPIDANDQQVKIEEYINYNDARRKMQQRRAKVIAFLDCCRTKGSATVELKESSAACDSFANFCQIFACAPSCEAFEIEGEKLSFMTQTLLKALNSTGYRKKINGKIYPLIMKYYRDKNLSPSEDKAYARPWNLNQLAEDISLEDPIYGRDVETDIKDLLLELPKDVELYFNDPTMTLHYRCVRLEFQAEFSNSLMIYVSFGGTTLPDLELNTQELEKLGLHVSKNTKTSFRIGNLLVLKDAVQNSGTPVHLRFSFRMPHNITVTDKIELDLLSTLIDPTF